MESAPTCRPKPAARVEAQVSQAWGYLLVPLMAFLSLVSIPWVFLVELSISQSFLWNLGCTHTISDSDLDANIQFAFSLDL